jgi:hypothetical protein
LPLILTGKIVDLWCTNSSKDILYKTIDRIFLLPRFGLKSGVLIDNDQPGRQNVTVRIRATFFYSKATSWKMWLGCGQRISAKSIALAIVHCKE